MSSLPQAKKVAAIYNCLEPLSPWFAVRVKSNFERTSATALERRGFKPFVPTYLQKRQWSDRLKVSEFPLFPGYLFCRLDRNKPTLVLNAPGVIGIVSCGPHLLSVSEEEIEAVRRIVSADLPAEPWSYLQAGVRVRVTRGALRGIEGIILQESGAFRLVVQIELLQRSVSLKIDREWVEAIEGDL